MVESKRGKPSDSGRHEALGDGERVPALRVRGLVVRYGARTILDGVDMSVPSGDVRVILGGSGSGKSTLLRGILGLTPIAGGTIEMLGADLPALDRAARVRHFRRVGVMFQNGALFGSLTVAQNIALPLKEHARLPENLIRELVRMKLELVQMTHAEHLYPDQLSGGMIKRAALARAMILDPEILFCDEPSAGLDPLTSAELDALLLRLKALFNMTVVVVTHELQSIETIADSVIMLGRGHVIAEGPIDDIRRAGIPAVDDFFARRSQPEAQRRRSLAELLGVRDPDESHPERAARGPLP